MNTWYMVGGIVALAVVLGTGVNPLGPLVDVVARGRRLTYSTVVDGVVQESVATLAQMASATVGRDVNQEALCLAIMVRSEDGSAGQVAKVYKCHVAYNQAAAMGWDVPRLITYHTDPRRAGRLGEQITGRFASGRDCYENDLAAAEYAQAERRAGGDPTEGALNFVDVGGFGAQLGTGSFAAVVERWGKEGKVPGRLPGTPDGLVFFWRGEVPPVAEGIA